MSVVFVLYKDGNRYFKKCSIPFLPMIGMVFKFEKSHAIVNNVKYVIETEEVFCTMNYLDGDDWSEDELRENGFELQ